MSANRTDARDISIARFGNVEVSRYETPTGSRLRVRRVADSADEMFFDPLELEGLTRARHTSFRLLPSKSAALDESMAQSAVQQRLERLQNEFALVGVAVARSPSGEALFIRDMNAGLGILLGAEDLDALLRARHMDFAPLIDTSDLVSIPEPDIDEV
jgi:hypothetical protein